jgi:glucose/arabinose dehydrogenase
MPNATPGSSRPVEKGYRLVPAVPSATFDNMLGFHVLPGSDTEAVVVAQRGQVWRVKVEGETKPEPFGDVSDRLISTPSAEEGLLGLAFSPYFETDGLVYLYYTAGDPRRSVLSRFQVKGETLDPASEEVILEVPQPFNNHNGGQIVFGPDGYLYVALGDGGSGGDPQGNGQNLETLLGAILRIDVFGESGYAIPPDNPFRESPPARPEIYAYGLRNTWRFSFDRATGEMWAGDVGQDRWEEVDRIVPGGNYGWNIMEGGQCFRPLECSAAGFQTPRAAYGRSEGCSITGGFVYRGPSMPELDGWYVYGDYCSGKIWALNTPDEGLPVLLADTGLPISSFGELADGELLTVTFEQALFRLERKQ